MGAQHDGVDLLLDQAVDRRSRAGDQSNADRAEQERRQRWKVGRGEEHPDDRGEHDQGHDARLAEREELPQPVFAKREGVHAGKGKRRSGRARACATPGRSWKAANFSIVPLLPFRSGSSDR